MNDKLFIFGTGSHARKIFRCADALGWPVAGFVDEAADACAPVKGLPVFHASAVARSANAAMFVAIGRAVVRRRLLDELRQAGWRLPALVHPSAWVSPDAEIGDGVFVGAMAVVESGSTVEQGAIVDIGVLVDHDCRIGAFAHLVPGTVHGPRSVVPPQT